jgi:selenocysteine lyase/cysteine desulfurase
MFRRSFLKLGTQCSGFFAIENASPSLIALLENLAPQGQEPDWDALRRQLLLDPKLIYLNSASIGCTPKTLLEQIHSVALDLERNPFENVWRDGLVREVDVVRERVATHWGAKPEEIALTENTTVGIAAVMSGIAWTAGDEVLLTNHEHLTCLAVMKYFSKKFGLQLRFVDIPTQPFSSDELLQRIDSQMTSRTKLWCCSHIDSFSGTRFPIAAISKRMRERGILGLCDGAQSLGVVDFQIPELDVDAFAASGHKWLFGPKGTGLLYLSQRAQAAIQPLCVDWNFAALTPCTGTRNCASLLAWKWILELQQAFGPQKIEARVRHLTRTVFDEVTRRTNLQPLIFTARDQIESGIVAFRLRSTDVNWKVAQRLAKEFHIEIKPLPPTCELDAGVSPHSVDYNALRVSPHVFNNEQDIAALVEGLLQVLKDKGKG